MGISTMQAEQTYHQSTQNVNCTSSLCISHQDDRNAYVEHLIWSPEKELWLGQESTLKQTGHSGLDGWSGQPNPS
jgi:hypothetical protein